MNKRIKKNHLYMKLEDACESIVETIPVPDHSTLVMEKLNILESGAHVTVKPTIVDGQEISLDASVPKDLKRG